MDVSTRPSHIRRQIALPSWRHLAAFLFASVAMVSVFTSSEVNAALSVDQLMQKGAVTGSLPPDTAHEVSITVAKPGEEQLSLTARLTTMSSGIAKDVTWAVRDANGELQFEETTSEASRRLAPGDYIVEAQYGAVAVRQVVTLVPGNSVSISFVLNAGGLRVLPTLKGIATNDLVSQTLVYATTGLTTGQLIAHSDRPGELMKLPTGPYRVETRFGEGNAVAVADVQINAGKISALEISMHAGIARLSFVGAPDATVDWTIKPEQGAAVATFKGIEKHLALKPGTYVAEARVNGETLSASFTINEGEQRNILLGN
jgi:hypothetical protein